MKVDIMEMNMRVIKNMGLSLLAVAVLGLAGCASSSDDGLNADGSYDPFEETNRAVFEFNQAVDGAFIHPVAETYNLLPDEARTGVSNVFRNLRSPVNFTNEVLQGDFDGASNVLVRAIVNTLIGVGGVFDVAGYEGLKYQHEDFGQTLGTWGVEHGAYLVVPVLGPSSTRDYVGFVVDGFMDPLRWYLFNIEEEEIYYGKVAGEYLTLRADLVDVLEDLERSSIDFYAATRSAYYQRRQALQNDLSDLGSAPAIPDYDE